MFSHSWNPLVPFFAILLNLLLWGIPIAILIYVVSLLRRIALALEGIDFELRRKPPAPPATPHGPHSPS